MVEASVRLTREIGYVGAGTIEYLVTADAFYFMEMNTRIQVEHPISEQVTGVDLVAEQLRIAAGEELSFDGDATAPEGVAFEFRINAEDPDNALLPESRHPHPLRRAWWPRRPGGDRLRGRWCRGAVLRLPAGQARGARA